MDSNWQAKRNGELKKNWKDSLQIVMSRRQFVTSYGRNILTWREHRISIKSLPWGDYAVNLLVGWISHRIVGSSENNRLYYLLSIQWIPLLTPYPNHRTLASCTGENNIIKSLRNPKSSLKIFLILQIFIRFMLYKKWD